MPDYPAWPERWEFFDGILKYDPHEPEDIGGELAFEGIPHQNNMWIVVHPGPEPKRHKKKRKRKRRTKKRKLKKKR